MSAEDVRKLHSKYGIYDECNCEWHHKAEYKNGNPQWTGESQSAWLDQKYPDGAMDSTFHGGREPVDIEEVGWTCAEPHYICRECHTYDGEVYENSNEGKWPCDTLIALEKL